MHRTGPTSEIVLYGVILTTITVCCTALSGGLSIPCLCMMWFVLYSFLLYHQKVDYVLGFMLVPFLMCLISLLVFFVAPATYYSYSEAFSQPSGKQRSRRLR